MPRQLALGFGDDCKSPKAEILRTNNNSPKHSPNRSIDAVAASLRPWVLDYLREADTEVGIGELRSALGYPGKYGDQNPQANPVNRILNQMRDAGEVVCRNFARGEPLLSLPPNSDTAEESPARLNRGAMRVTGEQEATGEKAKARDILAAIRISNQLDEESREATTEEREILARFGGFGPVALTLFPDPVKNQYKDRGLQELGEELQSLLSPEDYNSAKRTTFNAFYTSPAVMQAMYKAFDRLGVPENALVLEPGCGIGNFIGQARGNRRFIGIEMDRTSSRIARVLYPDHDIRIENFRDTHLPEGSVDAVIGNVPFANVKLDHRGQRFSLHDYFFAKSVDALRPGGVLALVTSHFTLDKQNAAIREYLSKRADFVGAIRLPSNAFKREGTNVVTDVVFLRKRASDEPENHFDPDWLQTGPLAIEDAEVTINRYFVNHPDMVLGDWSRKNQLYGGDDGYSVTSNGDLATQLNAAVNRLPASDRLTDERRLLFIQEEPVPARFSRPPPQPHITAGSFFVGENGTIGQVAGGETAKAVTHGSNILTANGSKLGKRVAALIKLRDGARRVLQSQNEGWPDAERDSARQSLNWFYDCFVARYGPINKTTFGRTRKGTSIRRMPNLAKFREDPDAMLVMSLEEYDEPSGNATKAAILRHDVVGKKPAITQVKSAEEGLLVSLDHCGGVDLPYIARLYDKPEQEITEELGDLVYLDPATKTWETADVYLSGNVRAKLVAAARSGPQFQRNAEALRAVQPPDLLPGDIEANLGAPWIPETDIQAFVADLLRVPPDSIRIGHLLKDAVWSVDADYSAKQSVAATTECGTKRASGITLLEQALNMKTPTIYDTIHLADREERVVNQEETLAAREKQKQIKERFRCWVFEDPDRAERLVRFYNDKYNNLRPRLFDGSHLAFPGMNQTMLLRAHQKDAVWRTMSSGNTLLAHAVGAGKTFVMAAAGMKLKEAALVKKPMFVVPNHMLEQFAREFMQLYPNAKLLIAAKEDMRRDRRKHLTAKIASGQWDGIIATHSSFERIGMSVEYQERFLREQIRDYEQLLVEAAGADASGPHRNLIKTIEKQKFAREERLKDLLAKEKKDDGLVFDELGVDHVFLDEAHYFKNLETATKMQRVAGIQTGGSQRAFDLYMKARYLDQQHTGHGVTFATGTPISNTMVEMYTVQRFLEPLGLSDRGIEHFDAWAATFGEVVESMEISPDGASLRSRSRFARFNNLPELQQMFRSFADVQTAEMLNLPRPKLDGGKPTIVACPMSERQCELQQELVDRYERLRSQRVDPREDNALAITTDGRKLALDARMLSAEAEDHPESKLNALVDRVEAIWRGTTNTRGTQIVFCDMGVRRTPWGYSAYGEVIDKLVTLGIPRDQIAAIGDANSDAKKQALFERVRNGSVRVLIGSTQKLGTGTNVQKRLVALHHLDAPWKPAEVEQREGRILRQGNDSEVVSIYRYVTEGSFDAFMWQALETKARFISQVMSGNTTVRRAEDIGGQELSYAEVKAIASGNPAVLTLAEADAELQRLAVLKKNYTDEQFLTRRKVRELPKTIERLTKRKENLKTDEATLDAHADDPISINGRATHSDDVQPVLGHRLQKLPARVSATTPFVVGQFRGLAFGIMLHPIGRSDAFLEGALTRTDSLSGDNPGPRAVLNAIHRLTSTYAAQSKKVVDDLTLAETQLRDHKARLGQPFAHDAYLVELVQFRDQLKIALSDYAPASDDEPRSSIFELAERIKQLLAANKIESAPRRPVERRDATSEQPITTRLRHRIGTVVNSEAEVKPEEAPTKTTMQPPAIEVSEKRPNSSVVTTTPMDPRSQKPSSNGAMRSKRSKQNKRASERQLDLF
jgi:N12 class adenine-specific DNA methylase